MVAESKIERLTSRQQRVAALLAQYLTDKQIAARLHITENAVNRIVLRIGHRWHLDKSLEVRRQIAVIVHLRM